MRLSAARLKGSTLVTNGVITAGSDEWAIYGGTGVFAMARGVIRRRYLADRAGGNTDELNMDVFCRPFGSHSQQQNEVVLNSCIIIQYIACRVCLLFLLDIQKI